MEDYLNHVYSTWQKQYVNVEVFAHPYTISKSWTLICSCNKIHSSCKSFHLMLNLLQTCAPIYLLTRALLRSNTDVGWSVKALSLSSSSSQRVSVQASPVLPHQTGKKYFLRSWLCAQGHFYVKTRNGHTNTNCCNKLEISLQFPNMTNSPRPKVHKSVYAGVSPYVWPYSVGNYLLIVVSPQSNYIG